MSLLGNVIVLGSGTSSGVPTIGCGCVVCLSEDERNKRLRASVCVTVANIRFVIDCGPDFRAQALKHGISDLHNVLLTHSHADHTNGIDDLRAYQMINNHGVNIYAFSSVIEDIKERFSYCFLPAASGTTVPNLVLNRFDFECDFSICDNDGNLLNITPIPVKHNKEIICGFRVGKFAYLTDVSFVPEESLEKLKGLDVLITSALRNRPHTSHMSISEAVKLSMLVNAKRTLFTHMNHELDHQMTNSQLPEGMELAYDGLTFDFPLD